MKKYFVDILKYIIQFNIAIYKYYIHIYIHIYTGIYINTENMFSTLICD